jgi:hypothetical protein
MIEIPRLEEPFDVGRPNSIKTLTYFSWHEILIQQRRIKWEFLIAKIMIQLRENILMSDSQDFKTLTRRIFSRCCQISSDIKDHHIMNAQICIPMLQQSQEKTHSITNFPWKTVRREDTEFCDSAQVVVDFMMTTLTKLASQFLPWFS